MPNKKKSRIIMLSDTMMIWIFILIIFMPLADLFFNLAPDLAQTEQRNLAVFPEFKLDPYLIHNYPRQFESFYNDNFGFRDHLLAWNNLIHVRLLKTSTVPLVVIGKEGWLFYTGDGMIEKYRATEPYSDNQLEKIKIKLKERQYYLSTQGIEYYVIIVPNKITIYPEYLPDSIKKVNNKTRYDQIVDYIKDDPEINIIDLRDVMFKNKDKYILYEEGGTHWNKFGAFLAYQEIINVFSEKFSELKAKNITEFDLIETIVPKPAMSNFLPLPGEIKKGNITSFVPRFQTFSKDIIIVYNHSIRGVDPNNPVPILARKIENSTKPSLLAFADSFMLGIDQFIREDFKETYYIASREFDTGIINYTKPDIVINELAERYIDESLRKPDNEPLLKSFYKRKEEEIK